MSEAILLCARRAGREDTRKETTVGGRTVRFSREIALTCGGLQSHSLVSQVKPGPNQVFARPRGELLSPDWGEPVAEARFYAALKRLLDIVGGLAGLIILFPVLVLVAAITKLIDGGPVLYPHLRVGVRGQEFTCYKFRTMVSGADRRKCDIQHRNHHDDNRTFKVPDDPRVTPFGRWLRRTSIDEVPQLWNVVKGNMSLVGPRPPIPEEVERYTPADMRRLLVKPGLTCIWQISGRSELAFPMQLRLDLYYIEHRSLWFDLQLILLTIPAVLTARGAY
jgi:lipopolysaccharide/colanic/teichoic acid biosynthesis glycosyltransferase